MAIQTLFYWDGPALKQIYDELTEYMKRPGGAVFKIKKDGNKYLGQVCDTAGNGGGNINDTTTCPGGLRCP
jgi:hypothetical protein